MDIISYALAKGGIPKAVSDFLSEHLTNPTNPPIDTSLKVAGAAADSKKVGDTFASITFYINDNGELIYQRGGDRLMAVVTTNLGVITAYGDAVAAGYTGTKAQWQALMANYATVGQQVAQDAQTASQVAQTATTKAGEASQSATDAENAAASITTTVNGLQSDLEQLQIGIIACESGAYLDSDGVTKTANTTRIRNSSGTVPYCSDDTHPSASGFYQIADSYYACIKAN